MNKIIIAVVATTFTSLASAAETEKPRRFENIGAGTGAVVGAIAGGPLGAILGTAAGVWIGDRFDSERSTSNEFEQRWTEASTEVDSLNGLIENSEKQIAMLETQNRQDARAMENAIGEALNVHILFRTDETEVADETQNRLAGLADLLARMDGMSVRVGGYADARGDAEHNEQLAQQRAANVRATLIAAGIPASRILVSSYGEQYSSADEKDYDALALDRRVQLTLIPTGAPERVARQ
ncbi:MAG: OmpA family protein [Candidatus Rariloculaceae bacterium]